MQRSVGVMEDVSSASRLGSRIQTQQYCRGSQKPTRSHRKPCSFLCCTVEPLSTATNPIVEPPPRKQALEQAAVPSWILI